MTSTTDMAGQHPDVTEISDLTEGLLEPSRTAALRRHLDACELCADVHASLEEIKGLLGSVPGPTRMPDDVAERIDAALAAEALLNATAPHAAAADAPLAAGPATPAGDVTAPRATAHEVPAPEATTSGTDAPHTDTAASPAHVSRETSTADRPAGHTRGSTRGPGRKERTRPNRRRVAVLGTVFTVAALGLGSVLLSTLNDGSSPSSEGHGHQTTAADTFSEAKLETQVTGLLRSQGTASGSHAPHSLGVEGASNQPKMFSEPTVPDCVREGIGRGDPALATQPGTYQGKEALLVVMPNASASTQVTAYIVDATCVSDPSAAKAKVLLTHSYTRR